MLDIPSIVSAKAARHLTYKVKVRSNKKPNFFVCCSGFNETNPPVRRACLHTHEVVVHEKVSHNECKLPLVDDHRLETDPASVDQSCLCCSFPKHLQKRTSGGCFSSDLAYNFSIFFFNLQEEQKTIRRIDTANL